MTTTDWSVFDDQEEDDEIDEGPNGAGPGRTSAKKKLTKEEKQQKIEEEKLELMKQIAQGDLEELRPRVASILNHMPQTRNDDVELWIRYWQTFDAPFLALSDSVTFRQLRTLTRPGTITRARAKIQNEYKLFVANDEVRRKRASRAVEHRDGAVEDRAEMPVAQIFLDESKATKSDQYYVVGSLWSSGGLS